MKKIISTVAIILGSLSLATAQTSEMPNTQIVTTNGSKIAFKETVQPGSITVINFWATWCIPCKKEIKNMMQALPKWKEELATLSKDNNTDSIKLHYMTVSIDDSRAVALAKSYAKSQGWDFPYYFDPNADLKRSLNFENVPFTIIVDQNGQIAWMHSGYEEGGENAIFDKVKELAVKK